MYIKTKTISCHYDQVFCLEHNNRDFISRNVDVSRTINNYNCVVSGGEVLLEYGIPMYWPDIRKGYWKLVKLYWEERSLAKALMYDEYWEQRWMIEQIRKARHDAMDPYLDLFFMPLSFMEKLQAELQYREELRKLEDELRSQEIELWLSDMMMQAHSNSIRMGLQEYDRVHETRYLERMDKAVSKMAKFVEDYDNMALRYAPKVDAIPRFASIEEIYDKLFEPSFCAFQDKQRPCRRHEGTYLEQIREGQARERQKKNKNKK